MIDTVADIKRKSVVGALSYFGRTAFLQVIAMIATFILSFLFTPEDFGIYGFVTQFIGILVFFSDIGLAAALIQKEEEPTEKEYAVVFTVQQILSWFIVLASVVIIASGTIEANTGPAGVWVMLALALSFPLATLKTIPSAKLERKLQFNTLVIPQIAEQLIFNAVLIYCAWLGMGALSYAYSIAARSVLGVVVMLYLAPWRPKIVFHKEVTRALISYGALFQINDFLARIKDNLFYVVLKYFLPLDQYGYIQWAKTWSMSPYNLTVNSIMSVTFPTFSRLQSDTALLKRAIEISLFFITLAIFPILAGMSVFVFPLVAVVEGYAKWQPALWSFVFFAASIGWGAISTPLTNTLNATGHITKTLKLMTLWTSLTWIVTPVCVWYFGYHGVAIAAFIISCTSFLSIWYARMIVPFTVLPQVWRQLVASGVILFVGLYGNAYWSMSVSHLILGIMLAGLSYLATLVMIGRAELRDKFEIIFSSYRQGKSV